MMDALVLSAPREFEVKEIPIPTPVGDEVLCKA